MMVCRSWQPAAWLSVRYRTWMPPARREFWGRMCGIAQTRAVVRLVCAYDNMVAISASIGITYHSETLMSLGMILLIVLVLLLIGVIPSWSHSRSWGYGPTGGVGLILVILLVLFLMGKI